MSELEDGLKKLESNRNYTVGFHEKMYGDDDDEPTHGKWVVWEETGNINDREWNVIATGLTPIEMVQNLARLRNVKES